MCAGGPGAAHEVEQFAWNDRAVVPVRCTGGAAGGKFNVPDKIFEVSRISCAALMSTKSELWEFPSMM